MNMLVTIPGGKEARRQGGKASTVWALVDAHHLESGWKVEAAHQYPPGWEGGEAPKQLLKNDEEPALVWWEVRLLAYICADCPFVMLPVYYSALV